MNSYFEVRWHGRGGQGTVTGAKSLAEAVQGTGIYVSAFPDYGPERRGAPLRAFNRFADHKIRSHIPIQEPNVVMVMDPTLIGTVDIKAGMTEKTVFVVNTEKDAASVHEVLGLGNQSILTVPANIISEELFGRPIPNSAMMGAFSKACPDMISLDQLLEGAAEAFHHLLAEDIVDKNLEAIKRGYQEAVAV